MQYPTARYFLHVIVGDQVHPPTPSMQSIRGCYALPHEISLASSKFEESLHDETLDEEARTDTVIPAPLVPGSC
jgi:hypothetical protein